MILAEGETSIREYYGMPDGEIPFNVYEDKKVRELSERINSRQTAAKYSNVHIISGSKLEQVRRIAYLTALKLSRSGSEVIPVSGMEGLGEDDGKQSKYQVFLLDEEEVRRNLPEGETFDPEHVIRIMRHIRKNYTRNHSIFLSLSQDTYDSRFKDGIEGGSGIDMSVVEDRKEKKISVPRDRNANSYWYAFLLPALSFLLSIIYHYFQANQFPLANTSPGLAVFQDAIDPALFFGPVVLSVLAIVALAFLGRHTDGRSRKVLYAGLILLIGEISVPVLWAVLMGIPSNEQVFTSSIIGNYTVPLLLFVIFQSVALISFLLIPMFRANTIQRAALALAFIFSAIFLVGVYSEVSLNIPPILVGLGTPQFPVYPMELPYNTFFFGLVYAPSQYVTSILNYLAYISQGLFALAYLHISLTLRKTRFQLKSEDQSTEPQAA